MDGFLFHDKSVYNFFCLFFCLRDENSEQPSMKPGINERAVPLYSTDDLHQHRHESVSHSGNYALLALSITNYLTVLTEPAFRRTAI